MASLRGCLRQPLAAGSVIDFAAGHLATGWGIAQYFDLAAGALERGKLIGDHRAIPVLVLDGGAVVAASGCRAHYAGHSGASRLHTRIRGAHQPVHRGGQHPDLDALGDADLHLAGVTLERHYTGAN